MQISDKAEQWHTEVHVYTALIWRSLQLLVHRSVQHALVYLLHNKKLSVKLA